MPAGSFGASPTINEVDLVATEAIILVSRPSRMRLAFGTDTLFFYVGDGVNWHRSSLKFYTDLPNVDMGYLQNNSKDGYYAAFITDKALINCTIGFNASTSNGGLWIDNSVTPNQLKIYMNSGAKTIMTDFSNTLGYLAHYPFSTTQAVKVWSGNSVEVGLNGRPMIQEYDISMGAYPPAKVLNGGTY